MTRSADLPGLKNRYLIESAATDGRFALIEHRIPPRTLAAPLHVHEREDEYSYVLSGTMGAQIGDEIVEAGPGELVEKPRGIWHAFWNPGDEETVLLELISPATSPSTSPSSRRCCQATGRPTSGSSPRSSSATG